MSLDYAGHMGLRPQAPLRVAASSCFDMTRPIKPRTSEHIPKRRRRDVEIRSFAASSCNAIESHITVLLAGGRDRHHLGRDIGSITMAYYILTQ